MDFSSIKALTIPEGDVVKIECNSEIIWELPSSYKNWVKYSTEADGKTIYNGGLGYKDGYRVRSGGAEANSAYASCTGFIKAMDGDVIRLSGYDVKYASTATNAINVYDGNHNNLGQIVANHAASYGCFANTGNNWDDVIAEGDGVWYWIVPSGYGIEYIRVTGNTLEQGSKMIITKNEEIT